MPPVRQPEPAECVDGSLRLGYVAVVQLRHIGHFGRSSDRGRLDARHGAETVAFR